MSETMSAAAEAGTANDEPRDDVAIEPVDTQYDGDDGAEEQPPEPEEIEEIELSFGAERFKVAKNAIPADVLEKLEGFTKSVQGDYTRKTQEVAEQRTAAAKEMELAQKLTSLRGGALNAYSEGRMYVAEIQRLEQYDLRALRQSNPDRAREVSDDLQMYRAELANRSALVNQHESAMDAEQERYVATQLDAGAAEMQRLVKGFDATVLVEYAAKAGIPPAEAAKWALNPKVALFAWKAMKYDALQASTKAATAAKPTQAPAAPVRSVAGKPSASARGPDQMSDDEYYRWEMEKHVKGRR